MSDKVEAKLVSKGEWIEIFPYGVTIGADESRPVMIFKDKSEKHVLPVWITGQEAQIAMAQVSGRRILNSPHELTFRYLKEKKVKIEKCLFIRIKGHHQYVEVHFKEKRQVIKIEARAEDVMSFCLHSETKFYCTIDHMNNSRKLNMEVDAMRAQMSADMPVNIIVDSEGFLN